MLPGKHPLKEAHEALDKAVRAVCGMKASADSLRFLFDLNRGLAEREKKGQKVHP